jgi:hypothetical protein
MPTSWPMLPIELKSIAGMLVHSHVLRVQLALIGRITCKIKSIMILIMCNSVHLHIYLLGIYSCEHFEHNSVKQLYEISE